MEFVIFILLGAAIYLYRTNRQQAAKIVDSALLIKDAATAIALLEAEIEKQDNQLIEYEHRIAILNTQIEEQKQVISELERWKRGTISLLKTLQNKHTPQSNDHSYSSKETAEN